MKIGYTRDHDHPDEDMKGDPTAGQMARFFYDYRPVFDTAGVPIMDEDGKPKMNRMLLVEFSTANDPCSKPVSKVTEVHKVMYKRFWDAFNRQEDFTRDVGTPLSRLKELDIIQQYQIQGMSILSIEQLADVSEGILLQHAWLRPWKTRAMGYMIEHKPKPDAKVLGELAELRAQLEQLRNQQAPLVEMIAPEEKKKREYRRQVQAASGKPNVLNPNETVNLEEEVNP
jgi:hypothetical protein